MTSKKKSRRGSNKCPKGEIMRDGYIRRGYVISRGSAKGRRVKRTYVPATCIEDRGKPGKGPKLIPAFKTPEALRQFGYSVKDPFEDRKKAIRKAVDKYGKNKIIRHLVVARIYHKNTNPVYTRKFQKDEEYAREYGDKKTKKKRSKSKK